MIALAWTYFPPTCWMTFAYSFSAPTATITPAEADEPDAVAPDADEQALASSARRQQGRRRRPGLGSGLGNALRMTGNSLVSVMGWLLVIMIMIPNFACNSFR